MQKPTCSFLEHNHKVGLNIFRVIVLCMVMFGAMAELPVVWVMADTSMGLMAIVNMIAILLLSGTVVTLAKDYNQQLKRGQIPSFNSHNHPEMVNQIEPGVWGKAETEEEVSRHHAR